VAGAQMQAEVSVETIVTFSRQHVVRRFDPLYQESI